MTTKKYTEFNTPRIIKSPLIYYPLGLLIILFIVFLINVFSCFVNSTSDYLGFFEKDIILIVGLFYLGVVRPRFGKARIYQNGILEVLFIGIHMKETINITDIKRIQLHKQWSLAYGNTIELQLECTNSKHTSLRVSDCEQFLTELKKHNPNIIIPEVPII